MNVKELSVVLVVALTGCILVAGFLPAMTEITDPDDTFTNTGLWRMDENKNGLTYTHNLDGNVWALNDVVQYSGDIIANNVGSSVIVADNFTIRANGWIRGADVGGNYTTSITIDSDTMTLSGGGISGNTTQPISGYGINKDGAYIMTAYNSDNYMLGDSQIYATGITTIDASGFVAHIEGSINDGVTITATAYPPSATLTDFVASNVVIHATAVNGYNDLYKLSGITADVSYNYKASADAESVAITGSISYSSYVIPYQVTAEKAIHADGPTATFINMLPLICIVGVLLGVVGSIFVKRYL